MKNHLRILLVSLILALSSSCIPATSDLEESVIGRDSSEITLDRLYSWPRLYGTSPSGGMWSNDGKLFAFKWNTGGERFLDLYLIDSLDGEPVRLTDMRSFDPIPIEDDERTEQEKKDDERYDGGVGQAVWSPDNRHIALVYRNDVYLVDTIERSDPVPLFRTIAAENYIQFSEDGKYLSFKRGTDLFLREMETGAVRQITNITKPNQQVSWYIWSPDSSRIWVHVPDRTSQKEIVIPDYTTRYVKANAKRRSYVGESITTGRNGIITVEGGLIKWLEDWDAESFVYNVTWSPDGKRFLLSEVSRDYRKWYLHLADAETMKSRVILEESKSRYFTRIKLAFSRDGKTIYFMSSRDGYNHIYALDIDELPVLTEAASILWGRDTAKQPPKGWNARQITKGKWDVSSFIRPKDCDDLFYQSFEVDPAWQTAFRISPESLEKTQLVEEDGTAHAVISRDGEHVMAKFSTPQMPWEYYWVDSHDEEPMKRVTHSPIEGFEDVPLVPSRQVTFINKEDGKILHGYIMEPPNIKPGVKYPAVLSHVYANSAKYQWTHIWDHYMAAVEGYVVMKVDFRASYGYGESFNTGYFHSIGIVDVGEAASAAEYLKSLPYVDGERLGIWGWSYGGFLTNMVMFTAPGIFKAGVAVAPVNDWKNYNEWYTRQRLDLPEDKEKLYKSTSPVEHAEGLEGKLLLIHGMQDSNVLFQDTVLLVQKLLEANKDFDVMFYPKDGHGIGRDESRKDVMKRIANFFLEHLGGPEPSE